MFIRLKRCERHGRQREHQDQRDDAREGAKTVFAVIEQLLFLYACNNREKEAKFPLLFQKCAAMHKRGSGLPGAA